MNQRIKIAWVEALRSGEYEQTSGRLARGGDELQPPTSFCCLGVLTDMYLKEKGLAWGSRGSLAQLNEEWKGLLDEEVQAWAGLRDDPSVRFDGSFTTLGSLNDGVCMDGEPLTFDQIADVIEGEL